jgi:hypothetical protein
MASTLMPAVARAALASSDALVGSSGTASSYAYAGATLAVHCAFRTLVQRPSEIDKSECTATANALVISMSVPARPWWLSPSPRERAPRRMPLRLPLRTTLDSADRPS